MIWTSLAFNQQLHVRITRVSRLCQVLDPSLPAQARNLKAAPGNELGWREFVGAWGTRLIEDLKSRHLAHTDNEHPGRATAVDSTFEN